MADEEDTQDKQFDFGVLVCSALANCAAQKEKMRHSIWARGYIKQGAKLSLG